VSNGNGRVFALLGDPVRQSLSPLMHNAAFAATGVSATYTAVRCGAAELPLLMRSLARAGGGGNVTIPHKQRASAELDHPHRIVQSLDACNTFWGEQDRLTGDNTDVAGVIAAVAELDPPTGGWLVAGTGGSARAVVAAAAVMGAPLCVASRDPARARAFARWAETIGVTGCAAVDCVLMINATPLGLAPGDPHPFTNAAGPAAVAALDLVYVPNATRWVRAMRARGLRAADGRAVLVGQGAAAFERWWPGLGAPLDVMRRAVEDALG
jgi:shikimate dehydrogenase